MYYIQFDTSGQFETIKKYFMNLGYACYSQNYQSHFQFFFINERDSVISPRIDNLNKSLEVKEYGAGF